MIEIGKLLAISVAGNTVARWLIAAGITLAVLGALLLVRWFVRARYARMKASARHELLEVPFRIADRTLALFLVAVAAGIGLGTLALAPEQRELVSTAVSVVFCIQLGVWASVAVTTWLERRRDRAAATDRAAAGTFTVITFIARIAIWTLVLLLTLDNLGIDITALITGLGIGGVAVALAVQNILGDLIASLSITLDKPFVIGDFLIVDDYLGSVEYIGIKSTRLRSLSGEQIVMSNADLLASRVRNYGRMAERRVVFKVTVSYSTPHDKLAEIASQIRQIVEKQTGVRFDRSHLAAFTPLGIDYETVYYSLSPEYNVYMDLQQAINLDIHAWFESNGISFACPSRRLEFSGELALLVEAIKAEAAAPAAPA